MSDLQTYTNAYVTIDGKLLVEETSLTVDKKSGMNPVFTVANGFSGMSQGATTAEIKIDNAVPSTDFEFNPDMFMRTGAVVEVGVIMANRQSIMKGFITDASYSHSVNDAGKMSMTIMCRFGDFE
jgi:hypothetical protein